MAQFTIFDFCSGFGGPNPILTPHMNSKIQEGIPVQIIITDIRPNVKTWQRLATKSDSLTYASEPVDARKLLDILILRVRRSEKAFCTSHASFHHSDKEQAKRILRGFIAEAEGFA